MVTIQVSSPANVPFLDERKDYFSIDSHWLSFKFKLHSSELFLCFIFLILLNQRSTKKDEALLIQNEYIFQLWVAC